MAMMAWFWLVLPFALSWKLTPEENARLAKTCGAEYRSVDKMFEAEKLMNDEYPWMAIIYTLPSFCTGTLISPRHILTAAHCVTDGSEDDVTPEKCPERELRVKSQIYYYLGGNKCTFPKICGRKKVQKVFYHEEYDDCTTENDIAVLELDENVSESVATPICMPTRNQAIDFDLTVVGGGARGPNENDKSQDPIGLQKLHVRFLRAQNKFIDVKLPLKAGICGGDSGGALIQTNSDNKFIQLGVTSHGSSCIEHFNNTKIANLPPYVTDTAYDSFTDVRKYLDWICEKTGVCQEDNSFDQEDFPFYR